MIGGDFPLYVKIWRILTHPRNVIKYTNKHDGRAMQCYGGSGASC